MIEQYLLQTNFRSKQGLGWNGLKNPRGGRWNWAVHGAGLLVLVHGPQDAIGVDACMGWAWAPTYNWPFTWAVGSVSPTPPCGVGPLHPDGIPINQSTHRPPPRPHLLLPSGAVRLFFFFLLSCISTPCVTL